MTGPGGAAAESGVAGVTGLASAARRVLRTPEWSHSPPPPGYGYKAWLSQNDTHDHNFRSDMEAYDWLTQSPLNLRNQAETAARMRERVKQHVEQAPTPDRTSAATLKTPEVTGRGLDAAPRGLSDHIHSGHPYFHPRASTASQALTRRNTSDVVLRPKTPTSDIHVDVLPRNPASDVAPRSGILDKVRGAAGHAVEYAQQNPEIVGGGAAAALGLGAGALMLRARARRRRQAQQG